MEITQLQDYFTKNTTHRDIFTAWRVFRIVTLSWQIITWFSWV